uniref:Uncharacterized protein n=1 Tax=Nelumbo nucifera TaxID=4432 RepID=A0A822Z800_NELNU|nr:TPA_asm: hypothetical protein HUJ06_008249 [Nelumbo nucifera]
MIYELQCPWKSLEPRKPPLRPIEDFEE